MNMEVIFCSLGTRGDVLPFLSLAQRFLVGGSRVFFLTNKNWKPLVESVGAEFFEIADEDAPQNGRDDHLFYMQSTAPSFPRSFDFIAKRMHAGANPVIIYRPNMLGAECAAEKFDLINIKVVLQPSAIRSFERPGWPLTSRVLGPFGNIFKRLLLPLLFTAADLTAKYRNLTASFRRSVGLPKRRSA